MSKRKKRRSRNQKEDHAEDYGDRGGVHVWTTNRVLQRREKKMSKLTRVLRHTTQFGGC